MGDDIMVWMNSYFGSERKERERLVQHLDVVGSDCLGHLQWLGYPAAQHLLQD